MMKMKIQNWNNFKLVNENMQKAKSILSNLKIAETNDDFVKLKKLLSNNTGYMGKFTEWLFKDKIKYQVLEDLFTKIKTARLDKPIDDFAKPEDIIDYIIRKDSDVAVNQIINSIPSNARHSLHYDSECRICNGTGLTDCGECDGSGGVDCEACNGSSEEDCDRCKGNGSVECSTCHGNDNDCDDCYGDGEESCDKCSGYGKIDCHVCKGAGNQECKVCNGKGGLNECGECDSYWNDFIKFLRLHVDKKDIFIDFFSKKGGRYSGERYNYDESLLDTLRNDLETIINIPDVAAISKMVDDVNIMSVYESNKYLILMVNYEGIRLVGSSYWCIHNDESTFNDYVGDHNIQLVCFNKEKKPLIDDKSVMGITIDDSMGISAAHWEDDTSCIPEATRLINNLMGSLSGSFDFESFIIKAKKMYPYSDLDIFKNYDYCVNKFNKLYGSYVLSNFAEKETNELANFCSDIMDSYNDGDYDSDMMSYIRSKNWHRIVDEPINKLPSNKLSLNDVITAQVYELFKFNPNWLNESVSWEEFDDEYCIKVAKYLLANKYKLKLSELNDYIVSKLSRDGFLHVSNTYKEIDWDDIYTNAPHKDFESKMVWVLDNDFEFIIKNQSVFYPAIEYIGKNITTYKDKLVNLMQSSPDSFDRSMCEYIIDEIDDDDIVLLAAKMSLPKKLLNKFLVDFKKR